jgi:hypothetical protein
VKGELTAIDIASLCSVDKAINGITGRDASASELRGRGLVIIARGCQMIVVLVHVINLWVFRYETGMPVCTYS